MMPEPRTRLHDAQQLRAIQRAIAVLRAAGLPYDRLQKQLDQLERSFTICERYKQPFSALVHSLLKK